MSTDDIKELEARIRKEFYVFRNGLIADTLRKGGLEQKYIFGLQLPQIKEIADRYRQDLAADNAQLARQLWEDTNCREARLTACHLMPTTEIDASEATHWAENCQTREESDILAFRLLRYLPYNKDIISALLESDMPMRHYTATAIERFL